MMAVLKTQELAGLDLLTDGELPRFDPSHPDANGMVDYFISRMDGIRNEFTIADVDRFQPDRAAGLPHADRRHGGGQDRARDAEPAEDHEFARGLTKMPLKFTCTGPHMLSRVFNNCFYKSVADLAMDIAAVLRAQLELVDADIVQLDEAAIVGYPQDAAWAAEAINHVLDGILNERAVHICFGNYGGQPMLRGFWGSLIPFLNSLRCDHLVLEFARRGYDELAAFADLDPRIAWGSAS